MTAPAPSRESEDAELRRQLRMLGRSRRVGMWVCLGVTVPAFWVLIDHRLDVTRGAGWLLLVAIVLWLVYVYVAVTFLKAPAGRRQPEARAIPFDGESYRRWQLALTNDQRVLLVRLLKDPAVITRRITEIIEPTSDSLSILRILTLDVEPTGRVLVPVHEQKRGQLVDGLRVQTADGARLSTLTQRDTMHVLAVLMDELIGSLEPRDGVSVKRARRLKRRLRNRVRAVLQSTDAVAAQALVDEINAKDGPLRVDLSGNSKLGRLISGILLRVGEFYPLLVVVGVDGADGTPSSSPEMRALEREPLRIEVTRSEELERTSSRWRFLNAVYTLLNVAPPRLSFPLRQADLARSYHLQIISPRGMYFYDLDVAPLYLRRPAPAKRVTGENRSGHEFRKGGHLYLRDAKNFTSFRAEVSFKEGKPGSISQAFIWTLVLSLFGLTGLITRDAGGAIGLLVPLLFVGLTSGSIWQGVVQLRNVFGGRLATRLSSLLNVVLCIIAVVLSSVSVAAAAAAKETAQATPPTFATPNDIWWGVVLTLSFTNTLAMLCYWFVDSLTEQGLARRDDL